jgi:LPS sulfotransferase NodH
MDNLIGIAHPEWRELRKEVKDDIDAEKKPLARRLTMMSLWTSWRRRSELGKYGEAIEKTALPDPVFILGHWRSGTTLLHNLFALSDQFAYPRIYQVSNPHSFLQVPIDRIMERQHKAAQARKRPMDNVEFDLMSAAEDEFATCPMSIRSHMVGWSFFRQEPFYDRFLSFKDASRADYERWRNALVFFLKKVVFKYNCCTPLLKSPQHTARVRLMLEQFPNAKFIHVRRNPYVVFRSTQRLFETGILPNAFQKAPADPDFAVSGILRRYKEMYDAFFEDHALIPAGNYTEVAFEELEQDMIGTVARAFEAVGLDGYTQLEPKLRAFVESQKDYQKNKHPQIEESLRQRIHTTWQRAFDEFGYPA